VVELIFGTTQLAISINSQIPLIHVPVIPERISFFKIAPTYHVIKY
jgi:hypothetical protein